MIASNAQCFFHPRRWSCCTFISFSSWLFLPFLSLSLAMLYILKLVVCKDQLISNCTNNRTTQDCSQDTAVTPRRRTTKRQEGWWWHRTLLCFKEVRGWITILHEAMDQTQSPEARRYISFLVFEHKWMNQRRRTEDNDITWHKERKKSQSHFLFFPFRMRWRTHSKTTTYTSELDEHKCQSSSQVTFYSTHTLISKTSFMNSKTSETKQKV